MLAETLGTQMTRHLFKVEWVSTIPDHGVLLSPGVSVDDYVKLRPGDQIELRKPGNGNICTEIVAFYLCYKGSDQPPAERNWDVLIPEVIAAEEIPVGTDVWLVGDRD